jgi:hypothetical protein
VISRQRPQCRTADESVFRQLPVFFGQIVNGQTKVIQLVAIWQHVCRLLQADLLQGRRSRGTFDVLQHAVENRPGEVRLGVGQSRLVVRSRRLGEGKVSLPLQVTDIEGPLPVRAILEEIAGEYANEFAVIEDESLPSL